MLSTLHIENIAVIESADVVFQPGLNILTGETGSGKSIVIDSISAISGARTSRDVIRTGAKVAYISALFCSISDAAKQALSQSGIEPDEDGCLLVTREIAVDGRNSCFINSRPATLAQLKLAGDTLINIHGQHTSQTLLDTSLHLHFLDELADDAQALSSYAACYKELSELDRELMMADIDQSEKQRRIDMLSFQIGELEAADLVAGEETELQARRKLLSNAERINQALAHVHRLLSGGEENDGAYTQLSAASAELSAISSLDERIAAVSEQLDGLKFQADDCLADLSRIVNDFDFSPGELDRVEARLDQIYRLKKYGADTHEMLAFLDKARAELQTIESSEERRAKLSGLREKAYTQTLQAGQALSKIRSNAAQTLRERLRTELAQLDMENVQFDTEFSSTEPTAKGLETAQFLISVNKGEALKPLSKTASGGELSRIMLALLNVLSDRADTLIFDEIDAGVGGRAAQRVGYKLSSLAQHKQVLCVTHLSQIAALADEHFAISKYVEGERTKTRVAPLNETQRAEELARINSGDVITDSALQSAAEQLEAARQYKTGRS